MTESERLPSLAATPLPPAIASRIPPRDRWALDPAERRRRIVDQEMARRLRLSRFLLDESRQVEREEFAVKCRDDPAYFFRNVIWTMDPERNICEQVELPMVPFSYQIEPTPFREDELGGGWLRRWHQALYDVGGGRKIRLLEEKTRRTSLSITCCGFMLWGLRFYPGFHAWISSDNEEAIDHGEDWDALFAKVRYMWMKAHQFYPWLFPQLPPVGKTSCNKDRYIEFPKWRIGEKDIAPECWGNKLRGLTPNEVSGRGGAALFGFVDEAGWIPNLEEFLDNIEQMTPFLVLASTPPPDSEHPFAKRAVGEFGYNVSSVHWTMNPVMASGVRWDETADYRGPFTEKWRSIYYDEILKTQPSHVVARNYDLDYRGSAGERIYVSFNPTPQLKAGQTQDTDLYDPSWPLEIWYDVGRRDPWAALWVQISDATGEVRVVDYWMRAGVTVEWWLPLWLGWNPESRAWWRTFPEMRPWRETVPWNYGPEDMALIERWHRRFGAQHDVGEFRPKATLRPVRFVQDAFGKAHHATGPASVEDIMQRYGLDVISSSAVHHMEKWIEHANNVLTRTTISPHLAHVKPVSGGHRYPSLTDSFLSWRWLPSTPREGKPKPEHSIHSHVCTAFMFGAMQLPLRVPKAALEESGRIPKRRCYMVSNRAPRSSTEAVLGF